MPGDEGLPGRQRRLAMIAVMMTTAMTVFDASMVNVALPQIARAMNVRASEIIWVSNGYLLAAAMTLAIFASLAPGWAIVFSIPAVYWFSRFRRWDVHYPIPRTR